MTQPLIQVNSYYTRSINLERDANSNPILNAYIPTNRAVQVLEKVANTFHSGHAVRAWSLVGPYGSGKSSFALFLSHLFDTVENEDERKLAQNLLGKANPDLQKTFARHTRKAGYCNVLLTGSPEPLTKRLVIALHNAATNYWSNYEGSPTIVLKLKHACRRNNSVSDVIGLIKELQSALAAINGKGILIIIDELGKFLEYEARHQGANDIHLLQELAEFAAAGHQVNLMLFVLMHQAFEQYAKNLSLQQKNEWAKIQGRFESFSFLEATEQTLRVVAAAFDNSGLSVEQREQIEINTQAIAEILKTQNALSNGLTLDTAQAIFKQCYPLHPLSLLILPVLCQKIAQNERTLFSYLGSGEAHGFKYSLQKLKHFGDWIYPHELFDYFIQNSPVATSDHLTYRRWLEVITALERLGDAPENQVQLLKSIGLFNIIGAQGGLKASSELVQLCLPQQENTDAVLEHLEKKSVLKYQKFSLEYRVWQGSDFDLETALIETQQQARFVSLADILNQRKSLSPVVARKYSIQYATLRYFQPIFSDSFSEKKHLSAQNMAQIIFYLAENEDEVAKFHSLKNADKNPLTIYVLHQQAARLKTVLAESLALEKIQHENQVLQSDPVAQRELKDRLSYSQQQEEQLVSAFLEQPENDNWFYQGELKILNSRRDLQQLLSNILESVYAKSPIIKNELINRDKPSSQASGAGKKLLSAMLEKSHVEDLDFTLDKFPPEKSIYRALFKETGIHRRAENGILSFYPPLANNEYRLDLVWQGIDDFIKPEKGQQSLNQLYAYLNQPPFGIKAGVLPLLFIAYYLVNQRRLALYEDGVFCPQLGAEHFEILIKRPELFSFESFGTNIQADLFNKYLEKLFNKNTIPTDDASLVDIVKPLAQFIKRLPDYTTYTKALNEKALAVRNAFSRVQSPIQLLFEQLPIACGFLPFTEQELAEKQYPDDFLNMLFEQLKILQQAYPELLQKFQQQLTTVLEIENAETLPKLRSEIKNRYQGLEKYSHDKDGLKAFITRLQNSQENDTQWLESIAALLGKVPPSKWRLENQMQAEYQLKIFAERLKQLHKIHAHQAKVSNSESDSKAFLLQLVSEEHKELGKLTYIDADLKARAKQAIEKNLQHFDRKLLLAIAAEIVINAKD